MYKIQDIRITDRRFSYQVIRFKPTDFNFILGRTEVVIFGIKGTKAF